MGALQLLSDHLGGSVTGSRNMRLGLVNIDVRCYAPDLVTAITGDSSVIASALGILVPEWDPRKWSMRPEGTAYDVDINFSGYIGESITGEEFEFNGSTSDDPIESNPNFPALIQAYQGDPDYNGTGRANWPVTINGQRNPMHGVESYYNPGGTWTHRYCSAVIPASAIAFLGCIDTPPGGGQYPPGLSQGRNWLKIRVVAKWIGNVWQIEETWLLSGPYGWVPAMYQLGGGTTAGGNGQTGTLSGTSSLSDNGGLPSGLFSS